MKRENKTKEQILQDSKEIEETKRQRTKKKEQIR